MNTKTEVLGIVILLLLLLGFAGALSSTFTNPASKPAASVPLPTQETTYPTNPQLQLRTFTIIPTQPPSPTTVSLTNPPGGTCQPDTIINSVCNCRDDESLGVLCSGIQISTFKCPDGGIPCPVNSRTGCSVGDCLYLKGGKLFPPNPKYNYYVSRPECPRQMCYGKPVIYLFPTKPTYVSVTLKIPGTLTLSIPSYPQDGWRGIYAYPDSTLLYNGSKYHELYYESVVTKKEVPTKGFVVATTKAKEELLLLTKQLGLKENEQEELINYWLPKLKTINKPYLFIGVLTQTQKEAVDQVDITPKPDTRIEFLLYFKGLTQNQIVEAPQILRFPQRIGFTMVEWGGTIDDPQI